MKLAGYWTLDMPIKFNWTEFPKVYSTTKRHWFGLWVGAGQGKHVNKRCPISVIHMRVKWPQRVNSLDQYCFVLRLLAQMIAFILALLLHRNPMCPDHNRFMAIVRSIEYFFFMLIHTVKHNINYLVALLDITIHFYWKNTAMKTSVLWNPGNLLNIYGWNVAFCDIMKDVDVWSVGGQII